MSVRFTGNVDWIQRARTLWTVDSWGCDRARLLYRGSSSGKENFENGLNKWQSMPGYPNMRLETWNNVELTPSFPGVELHFVGFKSNSVPQVKSIDGTSIQSANGQGTDTATGQTVTGSFMYRASRTTWIWYEQSQPATQSRYATVRNPVNPFQNIISYSIQDADTGKRTNSIPYSAFVAVFRSLILRLVVSNYEREMIVPNLIWACRADVDYKILN